MNKLVKKLIKSAPDSFITDEFLRRFDEDLNLEELEDEEVKVIMGELANIDGLSKYLLGILKNDRIRHFNSLGDTQNIVRGAFLRTQWLYKKIGDVNEKRSTGKKKISFKSPRHG